jgi:hypothetical protein
MLMELPTAAHDCAVAADQLPLCLRPPAVPHWAGCSLSNRLQNGGWLTASGSSVMDLELTVGCPNRTVLSGSSAAQCNNRTSQWSPALGQCLDWQPAACRTLKLVNSSQALCRAHEMVLSGGGDCSESGLSMSQPSPSMQGWEAACANAAVPALVYAKCCPASVDTFTPPAMAASSLQPLLLPSGSFFQQCEHVQNDVTGFSSPTAAVHCGPHQQALIGGGACPATSAGLTGSHAIFHSEKVTGWSTNCSLSSSGRSLLETVSASVICCSAVRSPRVALPEQQLNSGVVIHGNSVAPPRISICRERSEVLLSSGAACPPDSALSEQRLFHAYARWVEHYSCRSLNGSGTATQPALVRASCSAISRSAVYLSEPSTFCPRLSHAVLHPKLGHVTLPLGSPFGFGASYVLNCSYQQPTAAAAADSASSLPPPAVYLVGPHSIECQADGHWTNGGQLGRCLVLDSRSCISVSSSSSVLSSTDGASTSLSCSPVSSNASMVMIAASASCPAASNGAAPTVLLQLGPANLSSWRSSCYDPQLRQDVLTASMQGICCSASAPSIFSTCNIIGGKKSLVSLPGLNLTTGSTSRIRCAAELTDAAGQCVAPRVVENSAEGTTLMSFSCPSGFALLPSGGGDSGGLSAAANMSCVTSDVITVRGRGISQQWQRFTVTTNSCDGALMQPPAQQMCCPSSALCSLPALPQHVDPHGAQTQFWPEGSQRAAPRQHEQRHAARADVPRLCSVSQRSTSSAVCLATHSAMALLASDCGATAQLWAAS